MLAIPCSIRRVALNKTPSLNKTPPLVQRLSARCRGAAHEATVREKSPLNKTPASSEALSELARVLFRTTLLMFQKNPRLQHLRIPSLLLCRGKEFLKL